MKYSNTIYEQIVVPNELGDIAFVTIKDPFQKQVVDHWHESMELIFVLKGTITIYTNGHSMKRHQNQCFVVNSKVIHSVDYSADSQFVLLELPDLWLKRYVPEFEKIRFEMDYSTENRFVQQQLDCIGSNIITMQKLAETMIDGDIFRFMIYMFEILEILYKYCSRKITDSEFLAQQRRHQYLNVVIDYVDENYMNPISSRDVSELLHLQQQYFSRYFKKHMGKTFTEYLCEYRLSKIYEDIIYTIEPIGEIISKHGFSNYVLFRKMFFEKYNCTPRELRKNLDIFAN